MAIVVPVAPRTLDLVAIQSKISTLAAIPSTSPAASQAAQLLLQTQREFLLACLDRGGIMGGAAAVLSSVAYKGTVPALAAITALQAQITTWTTTNPQLATSKAEDLNALQIQAVTELLNSGQMNPATAISTLSFTGAN